MYSKMKLVPLRAPQPPVDPLVSKISAVEDEMRMKINERSPEDERVKAMRKLVNDYIFYHRAWTSPAFEQWEAPVPVSEATNMDQRITAVVERPDLINFDEQGQLIHHGLSVPGTNILDLMAGVGGPSQEIFDQAVAEARGAVTPPNYSFMDDFNPRYASTPVPSEYESMDELPDTAPVQGSPINHPPPVPPRNRAPPVPPRLSSLPPVPPRTSSLIGPPVPPRDNVQYSQMPPPLLPPPPPRSYPPPQVLSALGAAREHFEAFKKQGSSSTLYNSKA